MLKSSVWNFFNYETRKLDFQVSSFFSGLQSLNNTGASKLGFPCFTGKPRVDFLSVLSQLRCEPPRRANRVLKNTLLALASLILAGPTTSYALGLGEIRVRSALNEAFEAEIELHSTSSAEMGGISVALAGPEAFAQADIERPLVLTQLRFRLAQKTDGTPYIRVYTQEPVKEPFLDYLIEVNWPAGRLLRGYTVLLDPPSLRQPSITAPVFRSRTAAAQISSDVFLDAATYGPVQPGDTLWSVAESLRTRYSANHQQIMLALLKANPQAFLENNVNTLMAGYRLRVPEGLELSVSAEEAIREVRAQMALWRESKLALAANAGPEQVVQSRIPINQVPLTQLSMQLPLDQMRLSELPVNEVPLGQTSPGEAVDAGPAPEPDLGKPLLKLVAMNDVPLVTGGSQASANVQAEQIDIEDPRPVEDELERLRNELTLADEALEVRQQESQEMRSRVAELEEQTAAIQRLITLKDDALADLQTKLSQLESVQQTAAPNLESESEKAIEDRASTSLGLSESSEVKSVEPFGPAEIELVALSESSEKELVNPSETAVDNAEVPPLPLKNFWETLEIMFRDPMAQGMVAVALLVLLTLLWIIARRRRINASYEIIAGDALDMPSVAAADTAVADEPKTGVAVQSGEITAGAQEEVGSDGAYGRRVQPEALFDSAHHDLLKLESNAVSPVGNAPTYREGPASNEDNSIDFDLDFAVRPMVGSGNGIDARQPLTEEAYSLGLHDTGQTWGFALPKEDQDVLSEGKKNNGSSLWEEHFEPQIQTPRSDYDAQALSEAPSSGAPHLKSGEFDLDTDYGLGFDLEKEADRLAQAHAASFGLADSEDEAIPALNVESSTSSSELFAAIDEVGTKLDLARAYIDMGDPEGAHGILDEVMNEGNGVQKQQALELRRQLA